jgi:uncharacterized membrane protein
MNKLNFPEPFNHEHHDVKNVIDIFDEQISRGQRAADWLAGVVGSWRFIITQSILLVIWVILNVAAWVNHWDPYPFILMNLVLSLQAAYTAPVIMMSQNRVAAMDRIDAHNDYLINKKAEEEIKVIMAHLEAQDRALEIIHEMLVSSQSTGTPQND